MLRILHIARYTEAAIERRVALMAAEPDCSLRLVRPRPRGGPFDADTIRDRSNLEDVRTVGVWRNGDPHRATYLTIGFGMRRARPDIVHAEEEPDSLAALHVAAVRRVAWPRARLVLNTWQNVNRRKRPPVRWVLRRTLRAADAVVCGNDAAVGVLRQQGYAGPAPVIPTLALDASIFHRRQVARLSDAFTIGYVGRLAPEKGLDTLVRAVSSLGPPALLAIAGAGPERDALVAQARAAGIGDAVRMVGSLDPGQVAAFLSAVDVLVLPSRSTPVWQEQFGRVLVEAMGCEVPVVASRSGAIPAVLGDAGLLFAEDDSTELEAHLRHLRASPERCREIGRLGWAWAVREHDPARRARETVEFYRRLVIEPVRRPR